MNRQIAILIVASFCSSSGLTPKEANMVWEKLRFTDERTITTVGDAMVHINEAINKVINER